MKTLNRLIHKLQITKAEAESELEREVSGDICMAMGHKKTEGVLETCRYVLEQLYKLREAMERKPYVWGDIESVCESMSNLEKSEQVLVLLPGDNPHLARVCLLRNEEKYTDPAGVTLEKGQWFLDCFPPGDK